MVHGACARSRNVFVYTVEPIYYGHFGTLILVLITKVSSIQRSLLMHNSTTLHGIQNGVLIIEVSAIQRFIIEIEVPLYYSLPNP